MKTESIHLGFEIKTGKKVSVSPSHLIATGITQLSGKTTTLEALIKRSNHKAIVFKTKIGETGFTEGTLIPPFFRERSDWQYVQSLLEATLKERLKFERGWIIRACKGADSLLAIKNNIDKFLAQEKLSQINRNIYECLQAYFELILPQLQLASFSRTLEIHNTINIMDLERFNPEIQSLVIRSVLDDVLHNHKNTIIVIPEAWKFLPQTRGNPCKVTAEEFIRQGATNRNFLWIDSQDMTGVDKAPLKQISTWILGLQTEKNEVTRTLDQIPLSRMQKPTPNQIMTLQLGHFYLCTPRYTKLVYVQPAWLAEQTAMDIATGKIKVDSVRKPDKIAPFTISGDITSENKTVRTVITDAGLRQDMIRLRHDFFEKVSDLARQIQSLGQQLIDVKLQKQIVNIDEIVSLVMQKMPVTVVNGANLDLDTEKVVKEVLSRIPKAPGTAIYEVAPLEKIHKGFLNAAKDKIIADIKTLGVESKKALKYIESMGRGVKSNELITKCFLMKDSGGARNKASTTLKELAGIEVIRRDKGGTNFPKMKDRIKELLANHKATEQEIEQVYDHILMELL